ncbi:MAG TPA: hypothetical protein PLK94_06570 [Alphaproteobacteria bacterium]|nr:hypothetical protein [Alphaproteobacteria bacterium]HOO50934.1 hypothetical protein [Alphaproteobacteria bacterium]
MLFLLKLIWHRKSLILGILILSGLFGYTLSSLIKNPYVAQSAFIVENPKSDFYRSLKAIDKKVVASKAFYALPAKEQERFKSRFKMDTSLTGKLYDRYIGRVVDYAHPYDPATVLALHFQIEPFALAPQNLKFVFRAPDRNFSIAYSQYIMDAYQELLGSSYSLIYDNQASLLPSPNYEPIYIKLAVHEENIREAAQIYLVILFSGLGFIFSILLCWITERLRCSEGSPT